MHLRTAAFPALASALALLLVACSSTGASPTATSPTATSPTATRTPAPEATAVPTGSQAAAAFELRRAPANLGCDTVGVDYMSFTFRIDPRAADPVTARADTGTILKTFWTTGFRAGAPGDALVYDAKGEVVVRDGDAVTKPAAGYPRLHGYFVCLGPDSIYILEADPS